jgi:HK97 family phage major capsid protein
VLEQIRQQLIELLDTRERLRKQERDAKMARRSSDAKVVGAALRELDLEIQAAEARKAELEAMDARNTQRDQAAGTTPATTTHPMGDYSAAARVTSEPLTYTRGRPGDGASFFVDAFAAFVRKASPAASERLQRHENEVRAGAHGEEYRAVGSSAFSSLVTPQYLTDLYSENLHEGRVVADLAASHNLPEVGLTLNIPRGTTSPRVAVQAAEGNAVQETPYGSNDLAVPVATYAGMQDVSRQSLERGVGVDEIIFADLVGDYAAKIDQDAISGPGTGGRHKGIRFATGINAVTAKGSGAVPGNGRQLLTSIHDAVQRVNSARFLPASAVVFHPRRWGWLLDQSDSQGRPLVLSATAYGPSNAIGVGQAAAAPGPVGTVAGVPAYIDPNVPTTVSSSTFGNEDVVLVYRRADTHLWEDGPPRQFSFEEPLGDKLQIRLVLAGYSAFTAEHHPQGVAVISGSGLSAFAGLF